MAKHILISGGGTGGHIFPALSIAREYQRRYPDAKILFVGAEGRMEMERVPAAGFRIIGLPVAGFDRKRLWRNVAVLARLWKSMRRARKVLRDFRPDIAVGVGGYASGPVLKAAQKAGIPTLLQEQNSYAGVTNKLLAKKARKICVAYDGMERFFPADRLVMTGNPLRPEITGPQPARDDAVRALGFNPSRPVILVTGGSLGAGTINRAVAAALPAWTGAGAQVLWQTGKYYYDQYKALQPDYEGTARIQPFIDDMAQAYAAADIVVSRAGAGTISELQVLGKCCVLVPSPNVAEDHQRKNALALANRHAAIMVLDAEADTQLEGAVTDLLGNPEERATLSANCVEMGLRNAAADIVDQIEHIIGKP